MTTGVVIDQPESRHPGLNSAAVCGAEEDESSKGRAENSASGFKR